MVAPITELFERIASNESFSGSTKTFTDPRLCAAIVDRLTFGGTIIEPAPTPSGSALLSRDGHDRCSDSVGEPGGDTAAT